MLLRIFEQMNSSCLSSGIQGSGDTLKDVAMARGSLKCKYSYICLCVYHRMVIIAFLKDSPFYAFFNLAIDT